MTLPGSYANGFAPRDGHPLYPELWSGSCVGAWAPCLGPTGLVLRDWSGRGNVGTLTNGPSWSTLGRHAITFDGTNDYIDYGVRPNIYGLSRFSCSFSVYKTSNSAGWVLCRYNTSVAGGIVGDYFGVIAGTSIPRAGAVFNGATLNDYVLFETADLITLNTWHHVAISVDLGTRTNTAITVDGVPRTVTITTNGTPPSVFKAETSTVWTSARITGSGGGQNYSAFTVGDIMLFGRFLNADTHRILSSRPGIAYELAQRRRASTAVLFNRRRRLLVGASS